MFNCNGLLSTDIHGDGGVEDEINKCGWMFEIFSSMENILLGLCVMHN